MSEKWIVLVMLVASIIAFLLVSAVLYPILHETWLLSALGTVMAVLAFYFALSYTAEEKKNCDRVVKNLLKRYRRRQKEIIKMLMKKGTLYQSELGRKFGDNEARESVMGLVKAGIVRRKRTGSDYMVFLNE